MSTTLTLRPQRRSSTAREMRGLLSRREYWTEDEYLDVSTNHFVEFTNGQVEVLPMPTPFHQSISTQLLIALEGFVRRHKLGKVFHAPVPLWVGLRKYREPDLVFVTSARLSKTWKRDRKLDQADLVVEILSDGVKNRKRDLILKKAEYAEAGISEYWVVDPQKLQIFVWKLRNGKYVTHGEYGLNDNLQSVVLPNFQLAVRDLF